MVQKKNTLTRTGIVALLACVCCILWGSAIPVIKTGYRLMEVDAAVMVMGMASRRQVFKMCLALSGRSEGRGEGA